MSPPDAWQGEVLEASLQEKPESLAGNLELVVPLSEVLAATLFRARLAGIPLGETVVVWVNGTRVGPLALTVPKLADVGYLEESGILTYAGWREASLFIPAQLLKAGENTLLLESSLAKGYLKQASLQLLPQRASNAVVGMAADPLPVDASQVLNPPQLVDSLPEFSAQ